MPRTLDDVAFPLRTQRLTIRRARPEDAAAIWAYRRLEPVARFMTALPGPLEDFRTTFTEPDRLGRTLVVELVDGTLVGDLMVRVDDAWAQTEVAAQAAGTQAEIGWALDPAHQGHGYATEAVRELLRLCFDDLGLRRVVALCFAANEPSWRLMERVGMRRETHTVRESLHRSGEWMDGLGYAILAEEWRARA
ncbi:MAG TPA: GNAT family protein [Actinotalea caeni]|uniref:GNAT family N-acetyltransferase n=1 Tax=Actinotalea caeni TaxID=1348467 RepID=UPI00195D1751|nr:GNAT family protein [Actinotalea caeni]HLV54588.1 GNAT family protein [Actinotalea caeni]